VVVIDPARIQGNSVPPNVVIEQVMTGGATLRPEVGALELGVEQRDLESEYTALSFLAPANVRFRYRLEPYDTDWVEAGGRRTAYYTQVPPGRYTFRVIASNNDGVRNEQGACLELRLAPRFRETGAFRLLALLLLGLTVAGGFGWRVRSLRFRTRELARLVEERTRELREQQRQLAAQAGQLQELDHAKSRFFANVSHEFRTPLTLTIGPLEDLRERLAERLGEPPPRQLEMALRNARRLLRLVNQILDVAKLEAGQMRLRARPQDLVAFARGIAAAFDPAAERKQIDFEVVAPGDEVRVWFDPDALEKVLANLLSNAFKYTPDEGRIELRVETEGAAGAGVARLRVTDTGPGIPEGHLPHVFERFYQVDETNTRAQVGTGIGLALARELVELHGGSIAVESRSAGEGGERGWGAVFTATLPLGRAHLREDQVVTPAATPRVTEDGRLAVQVEIARERPEQRVAERGHRARARSR
jgi:signal transduction histidine kinase